MHACSNAAFDSTNNDKENDTKTESKPVLSIEVNDVTEGDIDTTDVLFAIKINKVTSSAVTTDFTTYNKSTDNASVEEDYVAQQGKIEISPGQIESSISIKIIGDIENELDESFSLKLSNISDNVDIGSTLDFLSATVFINNDDGIAVSLNDTGNVECANGSSIGKNEDGVKLSSLFCEQFQLR